METAGTRSPSANLSRRDRVVLFLEYEGNKRLRKLGTVLYRLTGGRFAPRDRDVILLTTRGRKSGREHTVLLQAFRDGENMVVVAANSGRNSHPDWLYNLQAAPTARVEIKDRTLRVRAEELSAEEAAAFWRRVLQVAPDYARYPRGTNRRIPMIRLVPATPTESVTVSRSAAEGSRNASRQPTEIAPGVYCLRTGRGITESNVYFVRSGSSWVLIDTAWANRGRSIKEAAESVFGTGTRPAAILLAHIHADHSGSAPELARMWGRPVYVHPDELPFAAPGDLSTVEQYANPLDRWVILPLLRAMPRRWVESMLSETSLEEVTRAFDPGAAVPGLPVWGCIPTPGHTPGHVSFFRGSDRVLIAGDAVVTVNLNSLRDFALQKQKVSGPPYISTWNWRAAKDSVAVLAKHEPRVIAGGHGIPMTGPETAQALRAFADRSGGGRERQPVRAPQRERRRPHMAHIEGEIVINRSVEEVFDVVADERNEPRYNPRLLWVEQISSGPIGRGTRFRAATKTMGRPVEMTIEFTDYQRPRRLGSSTHMPTMEIRGALTFEPVPEGTRMRWSWELRPRGVMRLLTPLIVRMGQRQEEAIWANLKQFMEAREGSLPPQPD